MQTPRTLRPAHPLLALCLALAAVGSARGQAGMAPFEQALVQAADGARRGILPLLVHRHRAASPDHQDCRYRIASAVLLDPGGLALSSAAIAADGSQYELVIDSARREARLVGADPLSGLAVLRFEPLPELQALPAADDGAPLRAGRMVLILGYTGSFLPTISLGIAGGVGPSVLSGKLGRFLQFTPLGELPETGGAVLDLDGKLVAIYPGAMPDARGAEAGAARRASPLAGTSGTRLALPLGRARELARELAQHGRVRRPWIGITIEGPNLRLGALLGLVRQAALKIARVDPHSPAANAGIELGDRVLSFDGTAVATLSELVACIERTSVDAEVPIRLERGGAELEVRLRVGEKRMPAGLLPSVEWLGVRLTNVPPAAPPLAEAASAEARGAVRVSNVLNPALAAWVGLQPGDVLLELNGTAVDDIGRFEGSEWMAPADGKIRLEVLRDGQRRSLEFAALDVRTDPGAVLLRLLRLEHGVGRLLGGERRAAPTPAAPPR